MLRERLWLSAGGYSQGDSCFACSGECGDEPAGVEAGLAMLDAGGDFADGVIAYEGRWLGAETFVSFDKKAVEMLTSAGVVGAGFVSDTSNALRETRTTSAATGMAPARNQWVIVK